MGFLMRGALIEYGSDFLGPIPNIVIFQFNPETLTRTIKIPSRPNHDRDKNPSLAGEPTTEQITLKASFSAADEMDKDKFLARQFGVGTRLAALEKMAHPIGQDSNKIGAALTKALGLGGATRQAIPAESYPRILFIWGKYRVLPVIIESMSITEQQYDFSLNPVQAEVSITLSVNSIGLSSNDKIGNGALEYSNLAKETQALANLATTVEQVAELIPF